MKKILSIILVACMMMTIVPVSFAQTVTFEVKTAESSYSAKVGETISVPIKLVPSSSSATVCSMYIVIPVPTGLVATVTAGKVPVSSNNGATANASNVIVMYDASDDITYTTDDSTVITVNYTAEKAGEYKIAFDTTQATDSNYDDLTVVAGAGATLTFEDASVPVTETCPFRANSTKVAEEQFEYSTVATAGTDVKDAGIAGLTIDRSGNGSELAYTKIVADPEDPSNLVLQDYHPQYVKDATTGVENPNVTNHVYRQYDANCDSDYIVLSHKLYSPAGANMRLYFDVEYKAYNNGQKDAAATAGQTNMGAVQAIIQFGKQKIIDEKGGGGNASITASDYVGKWSEWDYVIDTVNWTAELYVNHEYMLTFGLPSSYHKVNTTANYISGIDRIGFRFDRASNKGTAYWDNFSIRSMTAAQYTAAFANETVNVEGTSITTEDLLPVKTTGFGIPVTWTTDNANVTVDANGAISVADATVTYEDVVFTASFAGNTRTFTLDVMKQSKYAEYTFGAKEDKAYGMTSYNVAGNFYTQTKDGLTIRNSIVKFDEPRTFYYIVDDPANPGATAASHEVSKEEYDACELKEGTGKQSYKVKYYNTSAQTGDSAMNRYDAVGPDGDKRAAVWGVGHLRNETKLTKKSTSSMIHFDTDSTFSATDNALVIEVDVLDVGEHAVKLQYCNKTGAISSVSAKLTNSGEWITLTYNLTDADFAWTKNTGLGNNKQDMRFQLSDPTYISAVRIYDVKPVEIADADYTKIAVADYDVIINEDNTITAKTAITAEEAADAKLYVAYYNAKGNLVGVATSAQATDGVEQTLVTGKSVGATYNTVDYTLKTFVWNADLKPLR